ncbi:MAG: hypothetical protein E6I56_05025 [Chloroflexi bacterium]|nr:MAG: hypothetical protein E6I56_05025 [Chloroflexota bacterium]
MALILAACSTASPGAARTTPFKPSSSSGTASAAAAQRSERPRLDRASLAYDSAHKNAILFGMRYTAASLTSGGPPSAGALAETWSWSGGHWSKLAPTRSPPPRTSAGMTFDEAHQRIVLFGGQAATQQSPGQGLLAMGDTWSWDGRTWTQERPAHSPAPIVGPLLAYDPVIGKVVALVDVGGAATQTWTWNGSDWEQLHPANQPSPGRFSQGLTFDGARKLVVLYGGENCTAPYQCTEDPDAWTFDGTTWSDHHARSGDPLGRTSAAIAYDAQTQEVVVFGGSQLYTFLGDTWSWDGSRWSAAATSGPSPRTGSLMVVDVADGSLLLWGGWWGTQSAALTYYDTWTWKDKQWTLLDPTTEPAPADDRGAMLTAGSGGPGLRPLCSQAPPPCMSLEGDPQLGLDAGYLVFDLNPPGQASICISYLLRTSPFGSFSLIGVYCGGRNGPMPRIGAQVTVHANGCANVRAFPLQGPAVACLPNGTAATIDDGPAGFAFGQSPTIWWHLKGRGWIAHELLLASNG